VTKPIVATAALKMMEGGLLDLDDPVTKYLPYFTPASPDGVVRPITIRQLLSHSSGLAYETTPKDVAPGMSGPYISLEENLRRLAKVTLLFAPGTGWAYGTSIDVVGGVLAAINGSSLEAAVKEYAAGPLGMVDWGVTPTEPGRVTANYHNGELPTPSIVPPVRITMESRHGLAWEVDRIFRSDAPQSGGGGSCGTADDVMKMLEVYNGGSFLKPATVEEAFTNQIGTLPRRESDAGKRFTVLGAMIDDPKAAKSPCPVGTLDWGGAWGHNWIIDRTNRLTIAVLTNTAPEGCNGPFREDIRDAVYAAL
jgi:CubicO group peptidase (beta-lactamase class C family)